MNFEKSSFIPSTINKFHKIKILDFYLKVNSIKKITKKKKNYDGLHYTNVRELGEHCCQSKS